MPIALKQSAVGLYLDHLPRALSGLAPPPTYRYLMNPVSGSSRFDAATRNQEAINADIVRQVSQAPSDLRQIFRTGGYDGVVRWSARCAFALHSHFSFRLNRSMQMARFVRHRGTMEFHISAYIVSNAFCVQLRVHWLGLLLDETREQVVLCCDRCLALNIPVDMIASEALRVKNALE